MPAHPFAEIVRVECAKCRRECDLSGVRATLCGDRACRVREMQARVREMQARVRFGPCPRNRLRRSCVSSARNAGESATCPMCAQPSAEIVRVECAKCRRECDLSHARAALCRGDRACRGREMQARVRWLCSTNVVRERAFQRLACSTNVAVCGQTVWPKYVDDVAVPWGLARPWWEVRLRGAVPLGSAKHAGVNAACPWCAG